jgi:hypothetical protein
MLTKKSQQKQKNMSLGMHEMLQPQWVIRVRRTAFCNNTPTGAAAPPIAAAPAAGASFCTGAARGRAKQIEYVVVAIFAAGIKELHHPSLRLKFAQLVVGAALAVVSASATSSAAATPATLSIPAWAFAPIAVPFDEVGDDPLRLDPTHFPLPPGSRCEQSRAGRRDAARTEDAPLCPVGFGGVDHVPHRTLLLGTFAVLTT